MADETEQLRMAVKWKTRRQADNTVQLGQVLNRFMEKQVAPQQSRFEFVTEAWKEILPAELSEHCRITDVSGGRIKVAADSPSFAYELQLLSCELIKEFARRCPRAPIKEIKFTIG